jgi:16S rRNA processing protein RimM
VLTDFPERFARTKRVFAGESLLPMNVEHARVDSRRVLLKIEGIDSREAAQAVVGSTLYIPDAEAVKLPPGTFFWHEIIGLSVRSTEGVDLGRVTQILETGANDVYVVEGSQGEALIPATQDVVRSIDVANGLITIEIIEGLL